MKKNLGLHIYYIFIAVFFTLQLLTYINWPGDQTWFAERAAEINFDYIGFAFQRYESWSSRLFIESATMFFSVHYYIFDIVLFISTYFFLYTFNDLLLHNKDIKIKLITPIIFILLFPSELFIGAGLIATITNYLFPMFAFTISLWLFSQKKIQFFVLAIPLLLFAVMQEQIAFYSFLVTIFIIILEYFWNKKINYSGIVIMIISFIGVVSARISPGSEIRLSEEISVWYPEFNDLTLWQKVYYGFVETNRILFVDLDLSIIPLLFIFILTLSIMKKKYISAGFSFLILFITSSQQLDIMTPLRTLKYAIANVGEDPPLIETLYIWLFLIVLLSIIVFLLVDLFSNKKVSIISIGILIIGYGARMLVSLSPTIYASGVRTFMPLVFSTLIVITLILIECFNEIQFNLNKAK